MQKKEYQLEIGGRILTATFSDLAEQANGSVMLQYGETIVLATVCMSPEKHNLSFFNLTVDYVERFYASGKILGSKFIKREGRPSEDAVLASRVIDRTLRPLFDHSIKNSIQVIVTVISVDENDPVVLAVNAASLALLVSDIPWNGPVGCVRVGKYDDQELKINPVISLRESGTKYNFDLLICAKENKINMIEASARQVKEEEIGNALEYAVLEIVKLESLQKEIAKEIGKKKIKFSEIEREGDKEVYELFQKVILPKMKECIFDNSSKEKIHNLSLEWISLLEDKFGVGFDLSYGKKLFYESENEIIHKGAVLENKRADGREMDELRDLYVQAGGLSSVLHGSGLFYRGGTHVLSVLTLGGPEDRNTIDSMQSSMEKRFMHHYNFPPFSSGEVGRMGGVNRREIGHGALVEKALLMVMPDEEIFPYTIRLVSESLASNGSTSQASICASTIALMDGGVPIIAPVSGIAMGLMYQDENNYKILTDIQGLEDHHGDMDFKIAGTRNGITAIQLDVKLEGVSVPILIETMIQSKKARYKILDKIESVIPEPRKDISKNAPMILVTKINKDKIGLVIGSGGKNIKEIMEKTDTTISIEDTGKVFITGKKEGSIEAKKIIEEMTHDFSVGEEMNAEVVRIADFGVFVKLNDYTDGLVHISELAPFRVDKVSDIIKEGMVVPVKVIKVDKDNDRIALSIKAINKDFFNHSKK